MPNSKLENKSYQVPQQLQQFLGSTISYSNLNMTKSRLNQAKKTNIGEFNRKGGDNVLRWAEETLKNDTNVIHTVKKTGMDAGRENQFLKSHEKDKANANPTKPDGGLPKINKGNVMRKVMTGQEVYNESFNKEIDNIIYLIEYMNNNKKQI